MANVKLSQIALSGANLATGDYLVGVQGGTADVLFSPVQATAGSNGIVTPYQFGAIGDNNSHALSTRYATLAAAQAVYSFATSLAQEIDYCAVQKAFYTAFGFPGSEHSTNTALNLVVRLQAGSYFIGNDYIKTVNLHSGLVYGDGKLVTMLRATGQFVIQTNGCWYTTWRNFEVNLDTAGGTAAFDLDGNISHVGTTNGVQGNTLQDMLITTSGSTYGLALLRQGGSFGQGDNNTYINLHLSGATTACYYQLGANAIENYFYGGDTQSYPSIGHQHLQGWAHYFGHSFECTNNQTQLLTGGQDLFFTGADESTVCVYGCRTESAIFMLSQAGQFMDVRGCHGVNGSLDQTWLANHLYALNHCILIVGSNFPDNQGRFYQVTVSGTSGGTVPTWPWQGGGSIPPTVVDGGVTWTEIVTPWIQVQSGTIDPNSSTVGGRIVCINQYLAGGNTATGPHTSNYTVNDYDTVVTVDATSGPITVQIPSQLFIVGSGVTNNLGRVLTVKKVDVSANAVTVSCVAGDAGIADRFEGGAATDVIPGGSRGYRTYTYSNEPGGSTPPWWYTVSSSGRLLILSNANYYVDNTTGSNNNPGTSALPFATLQFAWDHLAGILDLGEFSLTINLAASATAYTLSSANYFIGGNAINIVGAGSASTKIDSIVLSPSTLPQPVTFDGLTVQSTGADPAAQILTVGVVNFSDLINDVVFGATPSQHVLAAGSGCFVGIGTCTIAANASNFCVSSSGGSIAVFGTITLSGTPNFNSAFVWVQDAVSTFINFGVTFSGSATGQRFLINSGTVNVNDAAGTFLPGNVAGVITDYGTYTGITDFSGAIASLPAAILGAHAFVTNATAPTFSAVPGATGALLAPVYADGTNWRYG